MTKVETKPKSSTRKTSQLNTVEVMDTTLRDGEQMQDGSYTPEWMRNGAPQVNPWLYALGVGAVTSGLLYLAYFALRLLANDHTDGLDIVEGSEMLLEVSPTAPFLYGRHSYVDTEPIRGYLLR